MTELVPAATLRFAAAALLRAGAGSAFAALVLLVLVTASRPAATEARELARPVCAATAERSPGSEHVARDPDDRAIGPVADAAQATARVASGLLAWGGLPDSRAP